MARKKSDNDICEFVFVEELKTRERKVVARRKNVNLSSLNEIAARVFEKARGREEVLFRLILIYKGEAPSGLPGDPNADSKPIVTLYC